MSAGLRECDQRQKSALLRLELTDVTEMLQLQRRSSWVHRVGIRTAYLFLLVGSLVSASLTDPMLALVCLSWYGYCYSFSK